MASSPLPLVLRSELGPGALTLPRNCVGPRVVSSKCTATRQGGQFLNVALGGLRLARGGRAERGSGWEVVIA
eukprot:7816587-Pyramimonas_sp.AAC.1